MKKLITIILILAMIVPAASMAAEISVEEYKDPLVGYWYLLIEKEELPEKMQKELNKGYYTSPMVSELTIYRITEDGTIYQIAGDFLGSYSEAHGGNVCGSWVKTDDSEYIVTVVGKGSGIVNFEDSRMYIYFGGDTYFAFHKMETFILETDLKKIK